MLINDLIGFQHITPVIIILYMLTWTKAQIRKNQLKTPPSTKGNELTRVTYSRYEVELHKLKTSRQMHGMHFPKYHLYWAIYNKIEGRP